MFSVLTHGGQGAASAPDEPVGADWNFVALREAYEATGGIARAEDLTRLRTHQAFHPFVTLDALATAGEVFSFAWRDDLWLPMFQFDPSDLSVRTAHRPMLAELAGSLDGWALAIWFVNPSPWLKDKRPLDLLATRPHAVLEAARTDRFIANG